MLKHAPREECEKGHAIGGNAAGKWIFLVKFRVGGYKRVRWDVRQSRNYGEIMRLRWLLGFLLSIHSCSVIRAEDHFLTIGGGESPTNNQVSLEKNLLYLQRFLSDSGLGSMSHDI